VIAVDKFFPIVKQNFTVYEDFLKRTKPVADEIVSLVQSSENSAYEGDSHLTCGLPNGKSKFAAYASRKQPHKYGLKIFAEYFGDAPCFRFCSRGRSHVNPEIGDGLSKRAIPTPHFHRVDSDGNLVAYQSAALQSEQAAQITANLQLGTNLFCQESNVVSPSGGFVVVKLIATEMDLSTPDPLDGATFPQ
jgi:hypothetical protein